MQRNQFRRPRFPDHPANAASHLMQCLSARGGVRSDSNHAAGLGRGLKGGVSDHAVRPSKRRGRIDSRDAAEVVGLCSGDRTRVGKRGLGLCSQSDLGVGLETARQLQSSFE